MCCKTSLELSAKTAVHRSVPSLLARTIMKGYITTEDRIFDWGCGRGKDIEFYLECGLNADGWDPNFKPTPLPETVTDPYNIVTCSCVLNVLQKQDRHICLKAISNFLPDTGRAYFSVRTDRDIKLQNKEWIKEDDGWITGTGTFQHGFKLPEMKALVHKYFKTINVLKSFPHVIEAQGRLKRF